MRKLMFHAIAVPFDPAHIETQTKAVETAADLAKHYNASLTLVGVSSVAPSQSAHSPKEFADKLAQYAQAQSTEHGVTFQAHSVVSVDITTELEKKLDSAIHEIGADLVIMASHAPGLRDYLLRSHSGSLATHTDISVLMVR